MMREKRQLRRRVIPKKVTLPNGQTFYVRYERTSRRNLLRNVTITKIEESDQDSNGLQKRNKVDGSMLGSIVELGAKLGASSLLKWWVSAGTKSLSTGIGKRLIDERIKQAPDLYRFGTSKIKNENVRKALESEVAN